MELKIDSLPDEVLLIIFGKLSIQDIVQSQGVCKHWNTLVHSDVLWKKFIPTWTGFVPPTKSSAYETVAEMWRSSIRIGNERWFADPLPELLRYEDCLRKAENENYHYKSPNSIATLYLRLNPCYDFVTKGKDVKDTKMNEICSEIWDQFSEPIRGYDDPSSMDLGSHEAAMKHAKIMTQTQAMNHFLTFLEPEWFLDKLKLNSYKLDINDNIMSENPVEEDEEDNDDLEDTDDSEHAWWTEFNQRLPVHVYSQIKALFADESKGFIDYYLSEGCFNENYEYCYYLVISDTAAFFVRQFYDL